MIHNANCPSNGLLECSHPHLNQPASAPGSPAWAHTAPMARGVFGSSGPLKLGTSVGLPELWWDLAAGFVKWMPPSWASAAKARWRRHLCCWLLRSMTTTSNQDYSSIQLPGEKGENNVVAPSCTTSCVVRLWPLGMKWARSTMIPSAASACFCSSFCRPKVPKVPKVIGSPCSTTGHQVQGGSDSSLWMAIGHMMLDLCYDTAGV